jgi:bifunctional NMN adenylyltransferase/nudix hydrolase
MHTLPTPTLVAAAVARAFKHDVVVYIGRFQPFHTGHLALLLQALELGATVVVIVGSAGAERCLKNPLQAVERVTMMGRALSPEQAARVRFVPMQDFADNDQWVAAVRACVASQVPDARSVALLGHFKDASSYYLNHFPAWHLESVERANELDATAVRNVMFDRTRSPDARFNQLQRMLPAGALDFVWEWMGTPDFEALACQHTPHFAAA